MIGGWGDVPQLRYTSIGVTGGGVDTSGSHVLVADEDPEVCGRVSEYLGQHDFRVTSVDSGKQMLEVIGREAVDLLLLEPQLGGGTGVGLTGRIREASKLPIVVL